MHWIRTIAAALVVAGLAMPTDAPAKKGHKKHGKKKGGRHAWVHPADRRRERDLARLVAARPRLPDGSRVVIDAPRPPAPVRTPVPRLVRAPSPVASDVLVAQRRTSAVDQFLRTHRPPVP
jgi:hypothetical protein